MVDDKQILPCSWIVKPLGEVLDVTGGSQPPKSNFIYEPKEGYIQLLQIRDFGKKPVPTYVLQHQVSKFCQREDVLIARYGASLGRIVTGFEGAYNVALAKVIPLEGLFYKRYLFFLLQTSVLQTPLKMISRSAQNGFAKHEIAYAELPIPPLKEQHRIVAKIEELFSEIDKGVESLKTAKAQLQVYRQALLKHAFEGKLTAQWRSNNPDKVVPAAELLRSIEQSREERYQQQLIDWKTAVEKWEFNGKEGKQPSQPKKIREVSPLTPEELNDLPELPENWRWLRVSEIADVQLGRQRSPKYISKKFPTKYIRAANLTENGLDLTDILDMEFEPDERQRYLLEFGDVLLSEASGSASQVGKPAVWRNEIEGCCFQNTVIRAKPPQEFSNYLFWIFKTYYICGVFSQLSGGVGINHLSAGKLASLAVPMSSIFEADKILELINEKLSVMENVEQTISTSLAKAEALRQSILKKAFSGQLVPQDPTDEPASELLKRIQAEKANRETKTKRKSTK